MIFSTAIFAACVVVLGAAPVNQADYHQTNTTPTLSNKVSTTDAIGGIQGDLLDFVNPTKKFQDGVHDCSTVPIGQGVIPVDWVSGLTGNWTTIMNLSGETSESCKDGFFCSYACQAGMSKTQWPLLLADTDRSPGGLECRNGKLYRSNTNLHYLCEWGVPNVEFKSEVSKHVSICRTDYPGSENMNIPTFLLAGQSKPATVIDGDTYFKKHGLPISAQYYVNNAGVSVEDGCIWGSAELGVGNWAPVVLGSGKVNGLTYLSLIPNPNSLGTLNFNIKIVGTEGSEVVGDCKYENGQYTGQKSTGCTVTVTLGNATIVFY